MNQNTKTKLFSVTNHNIQQHKQRGSTSVIALIVCTALFIFCLAKLAEALAPANPAELSALITKAEKNVEAKLLITTVLTLKPEPNAYDLQELTAAVNRVLLREVTGKLSVAAPKDLPYTSFADLGIKAGFILFIVTAGGLFLRKVFFR
jgi:hypothetical protein